MPDFGSTVFSQTDASNATGTMPSWSGTALPSTIDDAGRALQGAITREWNWRNLTITSTGSANTQVLTYTVAPAALYNGQNFSFLAGYTNTGAATLNINSLGATAIKKMVSGSATDLAANDIEAGQIVRVFYNSANTCFLLDSGKVLDGTVTTAKIVDANVTTAKIADSNVTTAKIANANVTAAKLDGAQSGSAPIYAARAWVSFNGTGTVAIRASGNVTSITDNGTGDYTVNFTTAMADTNYGFWGTVRHLTTTFSGYYMPVLSALSNDTRTTSALRVRTYEAINTVQDYPEVNVAVFR